MSPSQNVATVGDTNLGTRRLEPILTIDQFESVEAAACEMASHDVGSLIVLGQKRQVVGIVTERDIITRVIARQADPDQMAVHHIMTRNVISCRSNTTLNEVRRLMLGHNVRHLPVIEDGAPLGMVSARDLLTRELQQWQSLAQHQSQILDDLERQHPEVVHWQRNGRGRVLVD